MATSTTQADARVRGHALARMSVTKADGRVIHYYSLPWVPVWRIGARREVAKLLRGHFADPGEHWVETPDHPIPFRRTRKRHA